MIMESSALKLMAFLSVMLLKLVASEIPLEIPEIPESDSKNAPYEIGEIKFSKRHARSLGNDKLNLQVKAYGKTIDLNLEKRANTLYGRNTRIYRLYKDNVQSLLMAQNEKPGAFRRNIYEDPQHFASLTVDTFLDGSKIIQSANIGSAGLTIFPASLQYSQQPFGMNFGNGLSNQYIYRQTNNLENYNDGMIRLIPIYPATPMFPQNQPPAQIPKTIYLEVLVIIDYLLLNKIGEANIVNYLLTFWNQVDMMYRVLENPQYRITIAGIVLPQDLEVLEYFYKDPYTQQSSQYFEFNDYLMNNAKWLYKNQEVFTFDSYDLAVTMTSRKQITKYTNLGLTTNTGIAFISQACNVNHYLRMRQNNAVVLDDGNFGGIVIAAHEIGHLLGAQHDNRYPCRDSDGYIMGSLLISGPNKFKWSQCSLSDFKAFLSNDPKCLYNVPKF